MLQDQFIEILEEFLPKYYTVLGQIQTGLDILEKSLLEFDKESIEIVSKRFLKIFKKGRNLSKEEIQRIEDARRLVTYEKVTIGFLDAMKLRGEIDVFRDPSFQKLYRLFITKGTREKFRISVLKIIRESAELEQLLLLMEGINKEDRGRLEDVRNKVHWWRDLQKLVEEEDKLRKQLTKALEEFKISEYTLVQRIARVFHQRKHFVLPFPIGNSSIPINVRVQFDILKEESSFEMPRKELQVLVLEVERSLKRIGTENPEVMYVKLIEILERVMKGVIEVGYHQMLPFFRAYKSILITIVVKALIPGAYAVVGYYKGYKREHGRPKEVKHFSDFSNIVFEMDFGKLLEVAEGKTPSGFIASLVLHELNHILNPYDKEERPSIVNIMRAEGLAQLAECIADPRYFRAYYIKNAKDWDSHTPFRSFNDVRGLPISQVRDIGAYMWVFILSYFLKRRGFHMGSVDDLVPIAEHEGNRNLLVSYLNLFRRVNDRKFLEYYIAADHNVGNGDPLIGAWILE